MPAGPHLPDPHPAMVSGTWAPTFGRPVCVHQELLLLPVLAVAALLRFAWVDDQSFWQNELFSVMWVRHSFAFMWGGGMEIETNPPLYFTLLKAWMACFGSSVAAVRSLSAVVSLACLPCVYWLGRDIGGAKAALASAAVLAISSPQIFFANEARCYALISLLFAAALVCAVRFLRSATARARSGWAHGYVICCVALIYTHVSCLFTVATASAAFGLLAVDYGNARRHWLIATYVHVLIFLLALPELVVAAGQHASNNINWIPPVHPETLAAMLRFPFFGPVPGLQYASGVYDGPLWWESGVAVLLFAVAFLGARRSRVDRSTVALLAFLPALFLCVVVGVSLARPMMLPRIMIGATVPLSVLSGIALTSATPRLFRITFMAAIACTSAIGLLNAAFDPRHVKPDWRAMLPQVAERILAGDLVVVGPHASILGLAQSPANLCRRSNVRSWESEAESATAVSWLEHSTCGQRPIGLDAVAAEVRSGQIVWMLLDSADELAFEAESRKEGLRSATVRRASAGLALLGWQRDP